MKHDEFASRIHEANKAKSDGVESNLITPEVHELVKFLRSVVPYHRMYLDAIIGEYDQYMAKH